MKTKTCFKLMGRCRRRVRSTLSDRCNSVSTAMNEKSSTKKMTPSQTNISSVAEDAMRAVPLHMREGSYAMGATRLQTALRVVVPAATSGIVAAYILGISRAIGETMVVTVAAGQQPNFT